MRFALLLCLCFPAPRACAQCAAAIQTFPYVESFESGTGGWTSGGVNSDWALGTPAKTGINSAADGQNCWISGGLTGSFYNLGEASYVESPCFDFSSLDHPFVSCSVWWDSEYKFDGANLQYSLDQGGSWTTIGSSNDGEDCHTQNWYNHPAITYLNALTTQRSGWAGSTSSAGSCPTGNGSGGWLEARHCLSDLAGKKSVKFRFTFGAGTICNDYEGFAFDRFYIGNSLPVVARFNSGCSTAESSLRFLDESENCPDQWRWDFGDPASGLNNSSLSQNPTHRFSAAGAYTVRLIAGSACSRSDTISQQVRVMGLESVIQAASTCGAADGSIEVQVKDGTAPYSYQWDKPGLHGGSLTGLINGEYKVTVQDAEQCQLSAVFAVGLGAVGANSYIPNAFRPDSEQRNGRFSIFASACVEEVSALYIYDRWGDLIYEQKHFQPSGSQGWDGMAGKREAPAGVYVYWIELKLFGGSVEQFGGAVTLLR